MPIPNDAFQTLMEKIRTVILLFLVLMVSSLCGACATSPLRVPTVTPETTHLRLEGKFVWFDLFTSDLYRRPGNFTKRSSAGRSSKHAPLISRTLP